MGCFTDVPGKTNDFSLECTTAIERWNTRPTPVAPVSPDAAGKCGELETVGVTGVMPGSSGGFTQAVFRSDDVPANVAVCLRSQAVELLAAEIRRERDLAAKQLSEVVDRMSDDYIALKAELDQAVGVIEDRSSEYEALEAKLAAAEKDRDRAVEWRDHDKDRAERYRSALERIAARNGIPMAGSFAAEVARAALGGKPS